jgi:hypothetical protein
MTEPFYTVLRALHVGGGWVAFGVAPLALLALKGGRRHVLAGRCFVLSLGTGVTAGVLLALIRPDPAIGLACFGGMTLFFIGTGYLAPRIGRGSRTSYRWDRALTIIGALASLGLIGDAVQNGTLGSILEGSSFGGLGLGVAGAHARWRGPADPSPWRAEHLTSLIAAYAVTWNFIVGVALHISVIPQAAYAAFPVLGLVAIVWARRRFGTEEAAPAAQEARASRRTG